MGAEPGQRGVQAHGVLPDGQLPPLPALEDEAQQPQQGQSRTGVHHRPLASAADTPEQPAQKQRGHRLAKQGTGRHGQPAVHEVVGHQNEEHPVGVNGGDAGLYQVHEVKGEQTGAAQGHRGLAKEVFQEHIEHRQHQYAEQGAHEPPAEGSHAKHQDAQGDDELAQGRVGQPP